MPDIVSAAVRSRMMSGIRSRNTRPEMLLRGELHKIGFRFRLHKKGLPGKPDLVFAKYNAVNGVIQNPSSKSDLTAIFASIAFNL